MYVFIIFVISSLKMSNVNIESERYKFTISFNSKSELTPLDERYINDMVTYLSQFKSYFYVNIQEGEGVILRLYEKLNHLAYIPGYNFHFYNPTKAAPGGEDSYSMNSTELFIKEMKQYVE